MEEGLSSASRECVTDRCTEIPQILMRSPIGKMVLRLGDESFLIREERI